MDLKNKSSRELFRLTLIFSAISSAVILAVPIMANAGKARKIILPLIFWVGFIMEQIMFRRFAKSVGGEKQRKNSPGVIAFFKTGEGKKADIVLIVSLVLFILFAVIQKDESIIQYILIFAAVMSFRLHAIFNGRYYRLWRSAKKSGRKNLKRKEEEEKTGE